MCLDVQGGMKAKRQPFVIGVVLKSCGLGRRDVFVNVLSDIGTENTHTLLDWSRCSEALSRDNSYHPGFEVHVSLRATAISIPPNIFVQRPAVWCSSWFVLYSFVHVLCNLAGVVLELLRLVEICVPLLSFLVHVIRDLALLHDVLQHRLVLVETCP